MSACQAHYRDALARPVSLTYVNLPQSNFTPDEAQAASLLATGQWFNLIVLQSPISRFLIETHFSVRATSQFSIGCQLAAYRQALLANTERRYKPINSAAMPIMP